MGVWTELAGVVTNEPEGRVRERTYPKLALHALTAGVQPWRRIRVKTWCLPVILLMPAVTGLAYALMYAMGLPVRAPLAPALALFPIFLIAALLLGVIWALWHVIAMVQAGQSPTWIAWGCLDMVATRVLMVWLYNSGRGRERDHRVGIPRGRQMMFRGANVQSWRKHHPGLPGCGSGIPLFGPTEGDIALEHIPTRVYATGLVQSEYAVRSG
jgi:hypothetical protein